MVKALIWDYKDDGLVLAAALNTRLKREIPSIELKVEYGEESQDIPEDYDFYLLHLSATSEESRLKLRERNPHATIIGMNNSGLVMPRVPFWLEDQIDYLASIAPLEDRVLENLTRIIFSEYDKKSKTGQI